MRHKYLQLITGKAYYIGLSVVLGLGMLAPYVPTANAYSTYFNVGTLGGAQSQGQGINDSGQITGWSNKANGESDAFVWDAVNGIQDLGVISTNSLGNSSIGNDINNSGQIVGLSTTSTHTDPRDSHAFIWDKSSGMRDLGVPTGISAGVRGLGALTVNDNGVVGGYVFGNDGNERPFVWTQAGGFTILPTVRGVSGVCRVNDINISGVATGTCNSQAFVWDASNGLTDLGKTVLGATSSEATGINDSGQVSGNLSGAADGIPVFIWSAAAGKTDLTQYSALFGGVVKSQGINKLGQVVGYYDAGLTDPSCNFHAYVLDPAFGFSDIGETGSVTHANAINSLGQVAGVSDNSCSATPTLAAAATTGELAPVTAGLKASLWKVRRAAPTIAVGSASVVEGSSGLGRTIKFPVTLSRESTKTVTVKYTVSQGAGTATAGSDFVATSGTITFPVSPTYGKTLDTTMMVTTTIAPDVLVEPNETFNVTLSQPNTATSGFVLQAGATTGVGTIINDDAQVGLKASVGNVTVWKGDHDTNGNYAYVIVNLSAPATTTVGVKATLGGGTAVAGTDYVAMAPMTLTFSPGQYQKAIKIAIKSHANVQPNKSLFVSLSSPSAGLTIGKSLGGISILGNN